jgi:hypothetical protein
VIKPHTPATAFSQLVREHVRPLTILKRRVLADVNPVAWRILSVYCS